MHSASGEKEKEMSLQDAVEAISDMLLSECDSLGLLLIDYARVRAGEIAGCAGQAALTVLINADLLTRVNYDFPVYQVGGRHSTELRVNRLV